jgi:hypothetical protein
MSRNLVIIFVLSALLGGEAVLAAKCKFREDMDDMFSGAPTLRTAWDKNGGIISAVSEPGEQWLEVKVSYSRKSKFLPTQTELDTAMVVEKGASLEVTLKDGSVVELPALEVVKGSTGIGYPYQGGNNDYVTFVRLTPRYALSDSAISALGAQNATRVRVHGQSQHRDITIPKRGFKQIKEAVTCLRQGDSK